MGQTPLRNARNGQRRGIVPRLSLRCPSLGGYVGVYVSHLRLAPLLIRAREEPFHRPASFTIQCRLHGDGSRQPQARLGLRNRGPAAVDTRRRTSFDLYFSAPLRVLAHRGMRLRHMRDPVHGGANPPPTLITHQRRSAGPKGFPPLETRESDPFRCVELGLRAFAGRKRRWPKVSPGRCGQVFRAALELHALVRGKSPRRLSVRQRVVPTS